MEQNCKFDPTLIDKQQGVFQCPECGEIVIAGDKHPTFNISDPEKFVDAYFIQANYDMADKKAKDTARLVLKKLGLDAIDNPDKYAIDLLVYKDSILIFKLEVEHKSHWDTDKFPFPNVNIPYRKRKYFSTPTYFMMFNNDYTQWLFTTSEVITTSPIEEVHNKRIGEGEQFYKVDVNRIIFGRV